MDHYRPQRFGLSDGSILWPGKAKLFRIHLACAGLVAAACAAVLLDELLRRKAHPDEDLMYSVGRALTYRLKVAGCVEINQRVGCTRQFFTKSPRGDGAAVLARSSGEEPASPRHRAGVASMAWRTTRRFSTNAP